MVLANILPVGVTSNQLKGVFNKEFISFLWIIFVVLIMNFAKNSPLKNIRDPTINDIRI